MSPDSQVSSPVPLLVILGPTAVGKTGLAIRIAERLGGEIVSADSRQVYRFMDIGTAKPTHAEQRRIPHHLLDVVTPDATLSLSEYRTLAQDTIAAIHTRGALPMLIGGTGQYITTLIDGWTIPAVAPNELFRAEHEAIAAREGSPALYARLYALDPVAAERIHPNNLRRIIRALEVIYITGELFSAQKRQSITPYRPFLLGLTLARETLYARADARVEAMMRSGFLHEVRGLLASGYDRRLPSMSGIGYGQLAAHLLDGIPLRRAVEETQFATHDFIRRQYTWFKGHDRGIVWHDADQSTDAEAFTSLCKPLREWIMRDDT